MDENEQIPKILDGDLQALDIWIDFHSRKIVRFAYQYGLPIESALEVATQTFDEFRNKIGSMNDGKQLLPELYKIIIEKVGAPQPTNLEQDSLFIFEEDAELHGEIGKLDMNIRIPFILSKFHDFTIEEITFILNNIEKEIITKINRAEKLLQINHLDKRLKLLNKSYNRLPVQFKKERITEIKTSSKIVKKTSKSVRWAFVLSLLVVGILITSFFTLNKGETIKTSDSEYAVEYTKIRDAYKEALMLSNERFDKLSFIQSADMQMEAFLAGEKNNSLEVGESEFESILNELKIPSQMLKDFPVSYGFIDDEDKSIEFLSSYRKKSKDIISIYSEILWDYRLDVESFNTGGFGSKAEQLIKFSDEFPEELKNILATMNAHSITLSEDKTTGEIKPQLYITEMYQGIIFALHNNVYGYAFFIVNEPLLVDEMIKQPILEESIYHLLTMQETLEKVKEDDYLYPAMYEKYVELFHTIVKGSRNLSVFNDRGIVRNDFKQLWKRYTEIYGAHPTNFLLVPIVKEMEASGWKESKSWDEFNASKIEGILELSRTGNLEELMFGKSPLFEDDNVALPNEEFNEEVKRLYTDYKRTYDILVFREKSPIYTVGVYDYANSIGDPKTMYNLLRKNSLENRHPEIAQSLEEFELRWRKGFSVIKNANRANFSYTSVERIGYDFIANVEIISGTFHRTIAVYLDEEQNWYLYDPFHEEIPSNNVEENVSITDKFKNEIEFLYQAFSFEHHPLVLNGIFPSELIGLYLYAGEIADYQTQYELFIQDENTNALESEDYVEFASKSEPMNMEKRFSGISFEDIELDANGQFSGDALLTSNLFENPNAEPVITISMKWTEDGWRIVYNPKLLIE